MAAYSFARKRLLRDYAEVQREPSELIAAKPLDDNIFEWHVNLRPSNGPLAGVVLHLQIVFPEDYPNSPPNMLFPFDKLPSFVHPNLYSFGLCLDILQSYVGHRVDRAGWSTAYTVRTLLLQLQSFLFEFDAAPQYHGGSYSCQGLYSPERIWRVRDEASKMTCKCGHCGARPLPALPEPPAAEEWVEAKPSLLQELKDVNAEILLAERRLAENKPGEQQKHTEYLSAGAASKFLRAALHNVHVQIVKTYDKDSFVRFGYGSAAAGIAADTSKVMWDSRGKMCFGTSPPSGCVKQARTGCVMRGACTHSSLVFHLNGAAVAMQSKIPLRERLCGSQGTILRPHEVCAVLELRNVQVCIESVGCTFQPDNVPLQLPMAELLRSAEELPLLRAKQQILIERIQAEQLRQLQRRQERLRAEVEDLSKPRFQGTRKCPWARLSPDLLMEAFMYLDVAAAAPILKVCKVWRRLHTRFSLPERLQLCCFYTKSRAEKDVLGFGITVSYHDDGNIKEVGTELDVISQEAYFDHGIRRGTWGDDFEYFLPMVLDGGHARRSLPILKSALASIAHRKPCERADFRPWMALAVIPQVMNSFVVSLMREEDYLDGSVPRHASERALLGYCSFHHMLLALRASYPEIQEVASARLRCFIAGKRSKAEVPDLGQLIVYMTVTHEVSWPELVAALLDESQVRGVRWLLRDQPWLEGDGVTVHHRLQLSFQGRTTSLRLLMFQAYFICHVARPAGESLSSSLSRYNCQFGQATEPQKESLVAACHRILQADSWSSFYEFLGLEAPADADLARQLQEAVQRSRQCGYHGSTLLQSRQAPPEKVGVQKSLQRAFAGMEEEKQLEKLRNKELARLPKQDNVSKDRVVKVSRGRFSALESDED